MEDTKFQCTKCGQIGSVGRCCGLDTRTPLNNAARAEIERLTDHIAGCEKHPMRAVIEQRDKLRDALAGMIGASTKEELDAMELGVRSLPGCEEDRAVALNAIHALRLCGLTPELSRAAASNHKHRGRNNGRRQSPAQGANSHG